jgi:hypothetical protein
MFLVEFNGGPKDGLMVEAGFVPSRTLFTSATMAPTRDASVDGRNHGRAKYEIASTRVLRDASGLPLIEVRYRFVGLAPRSRTLRLPGGPWMSKCRAKIAAWMLTPVEYPLQTTHLVSNLAPSEAKLAG